MGPICGYCNESKKQRLLWDLYAGIAMNLKNNVYYGTYM